MTENGRCFVEWKEHFVSQERGRRVVHYFLKDSVGVSILAVVGTERSIRHMFYVVADEFLQAYGKESSVHAGFKWRSRREVVDWLTSMLSKQHLHADHSDLLKYDSTQPLGSLLFPKIGLSDAQSDTPNDKVSPARDSNGPNYDIVWSGTSWTCSKQLKHYPAFCRNGTSIAIQSFVFIMAKGENQYLAYLEDMYEDKKGQKKIKVRWFHHNQEVKGSITQRNSHPKEVFMTAYAQTISAECVDGPATILTREHYEKCLDAFPHTLLSRVNMCYRQFRSNRLKPFNLSKLRGYFSQPILSVLGLNDIPKTESISDSLTGEEDEDFGSGDNVKVGAKRMRSGKGSQMFELENSRVRSSSKRRQTATYVSSGRRLLSLKHVECWPWYALNFEVNEKIELLCQDSGIRGCWFRCTLLRISGKHLRVRYDDLQDEDGCGNLEEWILAFKVAAMPDKLCMRHSGRPTIRPAPLEQTGFDIKIGAAIDAWWSDGWWEGVVIGTDDSGDDNVHVFLTGESLFLNIQKKDLRISRDWLGDGWTPIESKPDILSAVAAAVRSDTKLSMSSTTIEDVKSGGFTTSNIEAPIDTNPDIVGEENINIPSSILPTPNNLPENTDEENRKMQQSSKENETDDDDDDHDHNSNDDDDGHNSNDDDDDNGKDDINKGKIERDVFETSGQNCREDLMEVVDL